MSEFGKSFEKCISEQAAAHGCFTPQDAVKLSFQAAFGAEHIVSDIEAARRYFSEEWDSVPGSFGDEPLTEAAGKDFMRINIRACRKSGLSKERVFRLFEMSIEDIASERAEAPDAYAETRKRDFEEAIAVVRELSQAGKLPFTGGEFEDFMSSYGGGAVHHSEGYRKENQPAYRIVSRKYEKAAELLVIISRAEMKKNGVTVVAIDGRAASGKTTLAGILSSITGADIVHADDFFLPVALRTKERLSEPGGNIHYERMASEVIPHLSDPESFSYVRFDCSKMDYGEKAVMRDASDTGLRIAEGSYSCHPFFGEYADVKVFCTADSETQMERIRKRNGSALAVRFEKEWIPMEEKYFREFAVSEKADFVLTT